MRIGSIAQHANIQRNTRLGYDEFANQVNGRLNNWPIYAWWDFTDPTAVNGGSGFESTTSNLQQCDDKGPSDQDLNTAETDKGPRWVNIPGTTNQDDYWFTYTEDGNNDYMQWTSTKTLNSRNFTMMFVFDTTLSTVASDQHILSIHGDGNHKLMFYIEDDDNNFAISHYQGSSVYNTYHATTAVADLGNKASGDGNDNFNWIYITGNSNGVPKMYIRGNEVPLEAVVGGVFPDKDFEVDKNNLLFQHSATSDFEARQFMGAMYEILIYNQSLTDNDLKQLDHYIKEKYRTYAYGRINGYALDGTTGGDNVWPT